MVNQVILSQYIHPSQGEIYTWYVYGIGIWNQS